MTAASKPIYEIDEKVISILKGIVIGVCIWFLLTLFFPSMCSAESFSQKTCCANCDKFCTCGKGI